MYIVPTLIAGTLILTPLLLLSACGQPATNASNAISSSAGGAAQPGPATVSSPAWAQALIGKSLNDAFPNKAVCSGFVDGVGPRRTLSGWAWDASVKQHIAHVILVDAEQRIVGAGDGGVARPDVSAANPNISDADTGWWATVAGVSGAIDVFGVTAGGTAVCPIGHIQV
jgi:hypothetical protein